MSKLQSGYQINGKGHPAGFCKLCWKFTEERVAGVSCAVVKGVKYEKIARPTEDAWTPSNAENRLKEFIEESGVPAAQFTLEERLYNFVPSFDYQLIKNYGLESQNVKKLLLDQIEQEMIRRDWHVQISKFDHIEFSVNQLEIYFNSEQTRFTNRIKVRPSATFCSDHNPNRSDESRRAYQNHRKRITDFENEINRLYTHPTESQFANDSDNDLQALLQKAYNNVFSSTLDRIKKLKEEGKKQAEIAKTLQVSSQVVSIALKREKNKALEA